MAAGPSAALGVLSHARDFGPGFFVKLALMCVIDALGIYGLIACWRLRSPVIFGVLLILLAAANYIYFSRRPLPLKYIFPGLAFLLVFQVFVVGYTVYVSFTNYGDGHNSTKEQAVVALLQQNERRVEGSPSYPLAAVRRGDEIGFAVAVDGQVQVGTADSPLASAPGTLDAAGRPDAVDGWSLLSYQDLLALQREVTDTRVPLSGDPNAGSLRTNDGRTGYVYRPDLRYDETSGAMTDTTSGVVYLPDDHGQFRSAAGQTLNVGWRVPVGFENYLTAFTDTRYAQPFFRVLAWTVAFSFLSVALCFIVGLFIAVVLNEPRLKGQRIFRVLLIVPYAVPGFLGALVWSGLLNRSYGFVNQVLLGGAQVGWLTDPWLAKASVLLVNLWLGFPYMFIICTGALQALPSDVVEAAKIDGASGRQVWRWITLPLVFIATAPLLISSFAFNFNNFNLIYMLTGGGPRFQDASVPVGATDILISMVYSVSGLDGSARKNYGLASALSIVIFVIVSVVSAISFRQTRKLEEVM
jgi:arabinogalactan oligomer/maltooligosaccharide transport system permease protein